jgi:hypothetical protein
MHIFTRAAGCAAMGLFVAGCGDGTSTSTTTAAGAATGSTGSGGDAAADVVDMYCNTLARPFCEATHAFKLTPAVGLDRSVDSCVDLVFAGYPLLICTHDRERAALQTSLRAGTTVFDQAQFDTCLNLLKAMTADGAAFTEPPLTVFETTCLHAFRGQSAPGDACPFPRFGAANLADPSALSCKDGRCEYGTCVPFLKPGDVCDVDFSDGFPYASATMLCNYPNSEVCVSTPGAGGDAGAGGAGGSGPLGTCRPRGELGDACDANGDNCDCRSLHCDATGKCAPPDGRGAFCRPL